MKKIISLLLTVCILVSMVAMLAGSAGAYSYSVNSALDYAANHWNDGVGLCAEFVSKCVQAGGIAMSTQTGTGGVWKTLTKMTGLPMVQLTLDAKGNATYAANGSIMAAGDVVVQYCNTDEIAPHIMLCAGYDSAGRAVYYAHNGAMNRGTYDLGTNLAYQHTTACDMGGRVIQLHLLDGAASTATPEVTFSNYAEKPQSVRETNARLSTTISVTGASIGEVDLVGVELYDGPGKQRLANKAERPTPAGNVINAWYDVNKELGYTLSPNTCYQRRFVARVRGEVFYSDLESFTTGPDYGVTVKLDPNGGTCDTKQIKIGYNRPFKTTYLPTPTREGYTFVGWACSPNGSNLIDENTVHTAGFGNVLYACWSKENTTPEAPPKITVYYDAQGGVCDTKAEMFSAGISLDSLPTPTKAGYEFLGWFYVGADGQTVQLLPTTVIHQSMVVYAQWKALEKPTITVYFDAQGGQCSTASAKVEKGGKLGTLPKPTRYGYMFEGWFTDANHGSKLVSTSTTFNLDYNITLYAKWKAIGYTFPFTDVFSNDWYRKDVQNAHQMGLINGKTATEYRPNDYMTYAECIKLAACMHQKYHAGEVTLKNGSGVWYSTYVQYAKENGIPCDFKDYNAQVDRKNYVFIFYYALPTSEYKQLNKVDTLPDVKFSDAYALQIYTFYRAGILTGMDSAGTFQPKTGIRRSEVATILSRMMDSSARKTFTLK